MPKFPSRRRLWAIAYGLTIVAAAPVLFGQQVWSSPLANQREGVIHLKRGLETVDVDSLLDTNQPDFFLRIEMDKPSSTEETKPQEPKAPEAKPQAVVASPEAAPTPSARPIAKPKPSPSPTDLPYEPFLLSDELPEAETSASGAREPSPAVSERTQIVADALYHAPRLAREGRYRQALELVDAALGVDDHVAPLHALRGSICYKLGRDRQAEQGWARALELDPRLTDAREALNWIRNRRR